MSGCNQIKNKGNINVKSAANKNSIKPPRPLKGGR